jgi:hypothetical protein
MLRERESPQAKRYARLVEQEKPKVDVGGNVLKAFVVGGSRSYEANNEKRFYNILVGK